jgi:hypothetical protein
MSELVEVLVFDGCPNVETALQRARGAIAAAKVPARVQLVRVADDDQARRLRFLGSPTVRVNGADVDPTAAGREDYGMQCRVYATGGRFEGAPPVDWITAALRDALPAGVRASQTRDRSAPSSEPES